LAATSFALLIGGRAIWMMQKRRVIMGYDKKQNILLIINPIAGRKEAKKILYKIVDFLCRNECKTTIYTTSRKGEATNIVMEHARDSQKIICVGGDGTLHEVLTGLKIMDLYVPVGYIPTGTTNDLARALKLPIKTSKAIETAVFGQIRDHDIGAFNEGQCFSYVASFGAFTNAAYSTPQWLKNMVGHAAYIFKGILSIPEIQSHAVKIVADGKEISGDFVFGSVSNSTVIAGLIKLPKLDIRFDDGKFEVLLIKTPKNRKELRAIVHGLRHQHYDERYVYYFKAKELTFSFKENTAWTVDGEFAGAHENVCIMNLQRKAQVIVPLGV
jgi:YegS/Rv2252/BmrU family lipid kinase